MRQYIFREIICSIILGSISCLLILLTNDLETLINFIKSITPPDIITYYFFFLSISHCLIWAIRHYFLQTSNTTNRFLIAIHNISDQVGFSLLGLYRTVAGCAFIIFLPALIIDASKQNLAYFIISYAFGAACIFVCCLLSSWQTNTAS